MEAENIFDVGVRFEAEARKRKVWVTEGRLEAGLVNFERIARGVCFFGK